MPNRAPLPPLLSLGGELVDLLTLVAGEGERGNALLGERVDEVLSLAVGLEGSGEHSVRGVERGRPALLTLERVRRLCLPARPSLGQTIGRASCRERVCQYV